MTTTPVDWRDGRAIFDQPAVLRLPILPSMANSFVTRWKLPLFLLAAALLAGCATQGPARVSVSGYSVGSFTAVP